MPRAAPRAAVLATCAALTLTACDSHGSGTSISDGSSTPVGASASSAAGFAGAALPATPAPGFALRDTVGRHVSLSAFRGQVVLLAFLDSRCGASCTLVAQQVRGALDELRRAPASIFVSLDPSGETPARVRRFLAASALTGRVRYLVGPPGAVRAAWRAYHVPPPSPGRDVERSLTVFLIDRRGNERVIFQLEQLTPEALAHDIGRLQAG